MSPHRRATIFGLQKYKKIKDLRHKRQKNGEDYKINTGYEWLIVK